MKKLLGLVVMFLLFVQAAPIKAQENIIRLSPLRSEHTAQPGSTVRATLTLQNPTNKRINVRVSAQDFEASPEKNGEPKLLPDGNPTYGLANWLADANLNKILTIPANQKIDYQAMFRVPTNAAERTYFGAVFFNNSETSEIPAVGSLVFITVGHPATELSISELSFGESEDAQKSHGVFTATVRNDGDGFSKPRLRLTITGNNGRQVVQLDQDNEGGILPGGSERNFTFTPAAELPNELLTATVSAVDNNGSTADKSIQLDRAPPRSAPAATEDKKSRTPWLLAALVTLSILCVIALIHLYRHRKTLLHNKNKMSVE